jgi:hypothetical protein
MLDLVNYKTHPLDNKLGVFYFYEIEHARFFENLLIEDKLWYELHEEFDDTKGKLGYYFVIKLHNKSRANYFNNLTVGRFRKPFINDPFFRYLIVGITLGALTLAVIGYILNN